MNTITVSYAKNGQTLDVRLQVRDDAPVFAVAEMSGVKGEGAEVLIKALLAGNTGFIAGVETSANGYVIKTQSFDETGAVIPPPPKPLTRTRARQGKLDL